MRIATRLTVAELAQSADRVKSGWRSQKAEDVGK
jgi:hypothetical protein